MAILRPGLHFSNAIGITDADVDIIQRWTPLSLLEAMENIVNNDMDKLRMCWELAGRCKVVLRYYYRPCEGGPNVWGAHALNSVTLARKCAYNGIPIEYLMLKPFNEPNMPRWGQWEGFGNKPADIEKYNRALNIFIDVAKNEEPELLIGGPHLTIGNMDVKFPNDPVGEYYYHGADMQFESSLCAESLKRLDVHFVHCYGFKPGEYKQRAYGLRFAEYQKYFTGKDVYIVEGAYGISAGLPAPQNTIRGEETADYLRILAEEHPQVKGIALWIGGDRAWFDFRHSDGWSADTHRPVVFYVEKAVNDDPTPPPPPPPTGLKVYDLHGNEKDYAWAVGKYGVRWEPCIDDYMGEDAWRLVQIRERCGPSGIDIWCYNKSGTPAQGLEVEFNWPDGHQMKETEGDGRVGFAYGPGSYITDPKVGGPHWIDVDRGITVGYCDTVSRLGMLAGTEHCHLDLTYRWGTIEEPTTDPLDVILLLAEDKLGAIPVPADWAFPSKAAEYGCKYQVGGYDQVDVGGKLWAYQTFTNDDQSRYGVAYAPEGQWDKTDWAWIPRD